jgi:hypothetical protein
MSLSPISASAGQAGMTECNNKFGELAGWAVARFYGRKVRSPQGSVPANGREGPNQSGLYGKCHRKYTACHFRRVRVKRCGKSAPRPEQFGWQGKPHAEQDQIGEKEWPAPLDSRVGR